MTKAEILKQEILKQYKSVRQFALEMEIPYWSQRWTEVSRAWRMAR